MEKLNIYSFTLFPNHSSHFSCIWSISFVYVFYKLMRCPINSQKSFIPAVILIMSEIIFLIKNLAIQLKYFYTLQVKYTSKDFTSHCYNLLIIELMKISRTAWVSELDRTALRNNENTSVKMCKMLLYIRRSIKCDIYRNDSG